MPVREGARARGGGGGRAGGGGGGGGGGGRPASRLRGGPGVSSPGRAGPPQLCAPVTGGDDRRRGGHGRCSPTVRARPGARGAMVDAVPVATADGADGESPPGQSDAGRGA